MCLRAITRPPRANTVSESSDVFVQTGDEAANAITPAEEEWFSTLAESEPEPPSREVPKAENEDEAEW